MKRKGLLPMILAVCGLNVLTAQDIAKMKVVFQIPGMDGVTVTQRPYKGRGEGRLMMDIYYPPGVAEGDELPAVLFVFGYPDEGMKKMAGARLFDTSDQKREFLVYPFCPAVLILSSKIDHLFQGALCRHPDTGPFEKMNPGWQRCAR